MKRLFLECSMGAAGDMLFASLLELVENKDLFIKKFNEIGLTKVVVKSSKEKKCGIEGRVVNVLIEGREEHEHHHEHEHYHEHHHEHEHEHEHHHEHSSYSAITNIIESLSVSKKVKQDAISVYKILADAESEVHATTIEQIHFHEVGTQDAIADIVGVSMLMEEIAPDEIYTSAIHVGSGTVECAHGILPVPAPATAIILKGVLTYGGEIDGELCTPTGAALLKYFTTKFVKNNLMSVEKIGYGFGHKDFFNKNGTPQLSAVRAMLSCSDFQDDRVTLLECNIDDMTPEELGFSVERLLENGALDVYTSTIFMKKNRQAFKLTVICKEDKKDEFVKQIFKYTSTIGIREIESSRFILKRSEYIKSTELGDVKIKRSEGYGVKREKIEYDDLKKIATQNNLSIDEVKNKIL